MASPAGTANRTASVAERVASQMLFQKDATKSGCAKMALNQRSDRPVVGRLSVFSGVNATRQMMTSGARTKVRTRLWKMRAMGPFFCMVSPEGPTCTRLDHAVVGQHDAEVCDKDDDRDGGSERPVQFLQ